MVGYLYVRYPIFRPKSLTMKMDLLFGSDQKKIPSPMSPERGAIDSQMLDILWMEEILHHLGWLKPYN